MISLRMSLQIKEKVQLLFEMVLLTIFKFSDDCLSDLDQLVSLLLGKTLLVFSIVNHVLASLPDPEQDDLLVLLPGELSHQPLSFPRILQDRLNTPETSQSPTLNVSK